MSDEKRGDQGDTFPHESRPLVLPPRVRAEVQRILDAEARRLLTERLDHERDSHAEET